MQAEKGLVGAPGGPGGAPGGLGGAPCGPQVSQVDPRCPRWCTAKNLTPLTHLVTGSLACPNPITPLCKLHHLANSGIYKSANTKKDFLKVGTPW